VIRINKPKKAPQILRTNGKKKTLANCTSYKKNSKAYDEGQKKFNFDSNIYGHKTVKDALIKAQHDKCCFCESKVTHIAYGDVEHFRPKAGVRQKSGAPLERPGYYWLAYEWTNLFFSCPLCNQRYKENLFPLIKACDRARSHNDDISREKPLFIDPAEDAEKFIAFRAEVIFATNDNPRGKATIKALGLDRDKLNDIRKEHYDRLRIVYEVANLKPPVPASKDAKDLIDRAIQNSSPYTSMLRCAVNAQFKSSG